MGDIAAQAPTAPVTPVPSSATPTTPTPQTPEAPVAQQPTAPVVEKPSVIGEKVEEKKAEGEAKAEPKAEPPVIDTKAFKLPDGFEVDAKHMENFGSTLKELNLNQEQGQKLMDLYTTLATEAAGKSSKLWEETNDGWVREVQADKDLGGDNLLKVKSTVSKALDAFGSPKTREALDMTGAGNHPEIIRFVYKMAEKLTEGGFVGGAPSARPQTAAEAIYGTSNRR